MNPNRRLMNFIPTGGLYAFWISIFTLSVFAFSKYVGQGYIYLLFTIISNALLYFGFRKKSIFFDTFIGLFFWLGFWLKLTIRVSFTSGLFHEAVGNFDGTGAAFDQALLVSSCGLFGFLTASFIREKLFFNYPDSPEVAASKGLFSFYQNHRWSLLSGFVALFVIVAVTNAFFGIYQRGVITQTVLPFGLNGIYKWLLLFGLASFSALILKFEFEINKKTSYLVLILGLLESFASNVSLLSRGMILNAGALLYGAFIYIKLNSIKSTTRFFAAIFLIFTILFGSSVLLVNYMRSSALGSGALDIEEVHAMTTPLFIDRWVGIEGVMAVTSYPKLGWGLWSEAWKETYSETATSFYDKNLIESPYVNTDKTKHHYISLPGVVAFSFYPGSFAFLFVCMFVLGAIGALIEISVFYLGGKNVILCRGFNSEVQLFQENLGGELR